MFNDEAHIENLRGGLRAAWKDMKAGNRPDWRKRVYDEDFNQDWAWRSLCLYNRRLRVKIKKKIDLTSADVVFLKQMINMKKPKFSIKSIKPDMTPEELQAEARKELEARRNGDEIE